MSKTQSVAKENTTRAPFDDHGICAQYEPGVHGGINALQPNVPSELRAREDAMLAVGRERSLDAGCGGG